MRTREVKKFEDLTTLDFFRPERKGSAQRQIGPQLHRGLGWISEQEVGQRGGGQPQPLTGRRKEEVEVTWRHLEHQIPHRVSLLNQTCWREGRNMAWIIAWSASHGIKIPPPPTYAIVSVLTLCSFCRFKWTHLSEKLAYEKAVHQQRMRNEISQAKRETDFIKVGTSTVVHRFSRKIGRRKIFY